VFSSEDTSSEFLFLRWDVSGPEGIVLIPKEDTFGGVPLIGTSTGKVPVQVLFLGGG